MANWTKEECILGLYAYCHVPFNKASNTNEWVVKIANLINRSATAVKMKIGNFGSFDPSLKAQGIVGLSKTSKMDEEVWDEYYDHWDRLAFDAEKIIAKIENHEITNGENFPDGIDTLMCLKQRINQNFFREAVLSSYNNICCISGISNRKLLEACHIISWSENQSLRTNPSNGLCMNPLFHRAYDNLLFSISPDYIIDFSDTLLTNCINESFKDFLIDRNRTKIIMPTKFLPSQEFLSIHHEKYLNSL